MHNVRELHRGFTTVSIATITLSCETPIARDAQFIVIFIQHKVITKWIMGSGRLGQFALARRLLYTN
jgi:hypothetical protein